MADYNNTVLSLAKQKESLLYFDYVIAVNPMFEAFKDAFPDHLREAPDRIQHQAKVSRDSLPPELLKTRMFDLRLRELEDVLYTSSQEDIVNALASGTDYPTYPKYDPSTIRQFIEEFGLQSVAVDALASQSELPGLHRASQPDVAVTLPSLQLIDTEYISWQQLAEFRADPDARRQLRRFRLFVYENYLGKSPTFIEDDLSTRLYDYNETAKKWGFTLRSAAYTALLDPKLVAAGVAGSFLTALVHEPVATLTSAAATIGLTVGKVALEIGKQSFTLREAMRTNPVSYIAYAREKLTPRQTD